MSSRTPKESRDAGVPPPTGGAARVVTLLLALYAAGAATVLLFRAPPAPSRAGPVEVSGDLQAALDENARRLRAEIQADLKKSVQDTKDQVNEGVRRLDDRAASLQSLVDAGKRSADGLAKAASSRAELLEDQVKEMVQKSTETRASIETLELAVRQLERRPAAAGPAPTATAPPTPAAPAPTPEPAPVPKGPTAEELAANKAKVRGLIAALADPDLSLSLPAATELGRLGDLEAVDALVKLLQHRDPFARTAAAEALGTLQACDAVPALVQGLLDRDPGVFLQAGVALRRITGVDSQLSGDSSKKDRNEARERYQKFWKENEAAVRQRLNQPAKTPGEAPPQEPGK